MPTCRVDDKSLAACHRWQTTEPQCVRRGPPPGEIGLRPRGESILRPRGESARVGEAVRSALSVLEGLRMGCRRALEEASGIYVHCQRMTSKVASTKKSPAAPRPSANGSICFIGACWMECSAEPLTAPTARGRPFFSPLPMPLRPGHSVSTTASAAMLEVIV